MSVSNGPPTPPPDPNDRSLDEALAEAQKDYARLLYAHSPSWSIDLSGMVMWSCSCSPGPRNGQSMETHILTMVRKARGPIRGPAKT